MRPAWQAFRFSEGQLIERARKETPGLLALEVPEATVNAVVDNLKESPSDERPHFYCRTCGEYHLKTHPHHAERK